MYNHLIGFAWLYKGKGFCLELDSLSDADARAATAFQMSFCRALYETRFGVSSAGASEQDLLQFCGANPTKPSAFDNTNANNNNSPSRGGEGSPLSPSGAPQGGTSGGPIIAGGQSTPASDYLVSLEPLAKVPPGADVCPRLKADLFVYDEIRKEFVLRATGVDIGVSKIADFSYMLMIWLHGQVVLIQPLNTDAHMHYNQTSRSAIWVHSGENGESMTTLSVVFPDVTTDRMFKETVAKCLFETARQVPFGKAVKSEDLTWVIDAMREDVSPRGTDSGAYYPVAGEDDDDDIPPDSEPMQLWTADSDDGDDDTDYGDDVDMPQQRSRSSSGASALSGGGEANSQLAMGYSTNRSFVVRGDKVGVFAEDEDSGSLNHLATIENLCTPTKGGGKTTMVTPSKVMLHKEDAQMLMLTPGQGGPGPNNKVYQMDVERGVIVNEWQSHDDIGITDIGPISKYSQATGQETFMAMNKQGMFLMDPRLPGNKRVDSQAFNYQRSTNPALSCMATTDSGNLVVGSDKGELRLFGGNSGVFKRAKTHLPGTGDPIIGVDVTKDGRWILATTRTYLLVIPARLPNGSLGFNTPMGKDKPQPRRLQIKPADLRRIGGRVAFTSAKFNVNPRGERTIVTSTGRFLITWDFAAIKRNRLFEYEIAEFHDKIVAEQFAYKRDASIVVTMPNDVALAKRVPASETAESSSSRRKGKGPARR